MKWSRLARVWAGAGILFGLALLIKVISFFPLWIENNYSTVWYPRIASFFRSLFGWIPFSVGDIIYGAVVISALIYLIRVIATVLKNKITVENTLYSFGKIVSLLLKIYIFFNVFWGLNYTRAGIAYQLGLRPHRYNTEELQTLTHILIKKVNESRISLEEHPGIYKSSLTYEQVFDQAKEAYERVKTDYPFLDYGKKSLKPSLYGTAGNYLGFLGYYNPFSGEAQVNVSLPLFLIPYVSCHEIAHQLGYGSESEANFVGYLAAKASDEPLFHYSVYFDLFNYANNELYVRDSAVARENYNLLDTLVKNDMVTLKKFLIAYKNPLEPLVSSFYNLYLKANQQENGIASYSEVIAWLMAYEEKYRNL